MASIKLKGDTSGEVTIQAPSVAGTNTLNLQASSGTLATTAQASIGMKNLIINGNMQIAQRGTSATGITTSSGEYYTVDRFGQWLSDAGTWTHAQDTDVPTGQGFGKSVKLSCTTANASLSAGSYYHSKYTIEAQDLQQLKYGTANAEKITLSFWIKSNKTGTYILELEQDDSSKVISQSYTINNANTWEKKTLTYDGNTADVINNDNGRGIHIWFWFAAGSNFTSGTLNTSWNSRTQANDAVGQANLADSTSNYINITGLQLEVGEEATPFEQIQYGQQLALCKRYCYVIESTAVTGRQTICSACSHATSAGIGFLQLPVEMRTLPSLSLSAVGHWAVHIPGVNRTVLTALALGGNGDQKSLYITFSHGTNASYGGRQYVFIDTWTSGTGKFILSAEL